MNSLSEDKELLERLRRGEESSLELIYDRYHGSLRLVAYQILGEWALAQDVVHDLFEYLWREREGLKVHTSLRGYLFTAVRHRSINLWRSKRFQALSLEDERGLLLAEVMELLVSSEAEPIGRLIEDEQAEQLRQAISSLPPRTEEVFRLHREEELSYQEISDHLGISINTVKYHLKLALATLREKLGKGR